MGINVSLTRGWRQYLDANSGYIRSIPDAWR